MKTTRALLFVTLAAAAACGDKTSDPCPQITAGGADVAALVSTGSLPVAGGGVLVSGTYDLTKLELVLAENVGAEARVQCEAIVASTRRESLRLDATSPTEGNVIALSISNDGNGVRSENRSRASYVSAGTAVAMTIVGTVCDTSFLPKVDGGIAEERIVSEPDTMALSRPYSSTEGSISFYATISYSDHPDCVFVSTYAKQ